MGKRRVATVWVEGGWVKIRAPYDELHTPAFVEELKTRVSHKLRQWHAIDRVWMVDPSALDVLIEIARKYYTEVSVASGKVKDKQPNVGYDYGRIDGSGSEYTAIAELLKNASTDCLKKVYRIMAAEFHPDHGGSSESMKRLNVAWDKICQQRGGK